LTPRKHDSLLPTPTGSEWLFGATCGTTPQRLPHLRRFRRQSGHDPRLRNNRAIECKTYARAEPCRVGPEGEVRVCTRGFGSLRVETCGNGLSSRPANPT